MSESDIPEDIREKAKNLVTGLCVKRGQFVGFRENEWLEANIARAILAERERLGYLLEQARAHVAATNAAEHLMDGFGPRSAQPSDDLLREIDAALR